jgi:hypothetical protein
VVVEVIWKFGTKRNLSCQMDVVDPWLLLVVVGNWWKQKLLHQYCSVVDMVMAYWFRTMKYVNISVQNYAIATSSDTIHFKARICGTIFFPRFLFGIFERFLPLLIFIKRDIVGVLIPIYTTYRSYKQT